ncbi:MAG: glycosyl hydrolase [Clostridia bacterium]|nr:glycosyl hydrolase [Clostridia bacterium]
MQKVVKVNPLDKVEFKNNVDYCVGTGRMGLALQKEYQDQLEFVQEHIGFKHIRGHGLFTDDMAIYHQYKDENGNIIDEYNFTYLDLVMDQYISKGLRPFLELGFMPKKMASGDQTIFYWKGNVTPPEDIKRWNKMVQETLKHLINRYGLEDVVTWPIEVWNEPNLPGFWKDADMEGYFRLFKETFYAIKEVDSRFRVGGPAICGVDDERWMRCFMEFCSKEKISLDFVTRHHYTTDVPDFQGHYGYPELRVLDDEFSVLRVSRDIIDSFPEYKGLEMHITEFNTSYIGTAPLHDTNQNAACVAYLLSCMGEVNESYSYWTFGDIFEEAGVPYTPFHGGFGMVANGVIPKPTFWAFKFFKELQNAQEAQGDCVYKDKNLVIIKNAKGYTGVLWNDSRVRTGEDIDFDITLPALEKEYFMSMKLVDEACCNPLKIWHDMGEPSSLSSSQKELLKASSFPLVTSNIVKASGESINLKLNLKEHGLMMFELTPRFETVDRGYDYNRTMQF